MNLIVDQKIKLWITNKYFFLNFYKKNNKNLQKTFLQKN